MGLIKYVNYTCIIRCIQSIDSHKKIINGLPAVI